MENIPNIAGWSNSPDTPSIHVPAYLVYSDLKELFENNKLWQSQAWLSKFLQNIQDLEKQLSKMGNDRSYLLHALYNWIHAVQEGKHSLGDIITNAKTKSIDTKPLEKYIRTMVEKDPEGLQSFLGYLERYLDSMEK